MPPPIWCWSSRYHPEGHTATDNFSQPNVRKAILFFIHGVDAFESPAEQYAMDTGNDPAEFTAENIANFKRQINSLVSHMTGIVKSITLTPTTISGHSGFTKLYEKVWHTAEVPVNWVEELGTAIANEEVLP